VSRAAGGFAQVEIHRCGEVVWLRHPFDEHGCELRDAENPEPTVGFASAIAGVCLSYWLGLRSLVREEKRSDEA